VFFDFRRGNHDDVKAERPAETVDHGSWPGFSSEEVRAREEQLLEEPDTAPIEPQGELRGASAAKGIAMLAILALVALLGAAGAWLVVGPDDPSAASGQGPVAPGGGNVALPPPTSDSTGTHETTTDSQRTVTTEAGTTDARTTEATSAAVTVPDVVGDPVAQARRRLHDADLQVRTRLVASSRPSGTVLVQLPRAGNRLARGDVVALDVANAATIRVPQVVGRTVAEAKRALRSVGLSSSVSKVPSSKPHGTVLGQSPGAGAKVRRGTAVALRVSTGPALADVPDVVGLGDVEARAALEDAGFQVAVVDRPTDDSTQDGVVVDQSPSGSTDAREGSTVTLTVARFGSGP
jgi:beta-lactam-binding protein with PASTA domain